MIKKVIKHVINNFGYTLCKKSELEKRKEELNYSSLLISPFHKVNFANLTLQKLLQDFDFETVLDIGSGAGEHAKIFLEFGKNVTAIDFGTSLYFKQKERNYDYVKADYYDYFFDIPFDAIWASHVLEHQPNPNLFLKKIFHDLKEDGVLAITVPPLKHQIVGGHLTLWNAGLLLYHLVFAGFNCKNVSILRYGYNIGIILKKKSIKKMPKLSFDTGDIAALLNYFPDGFDEPFDGNMEILNW